MTDLIIDGGSIFATGYYATLSKGYVDTDGNPCGGISAAMRVMTTLMDLRGDRIGSRIDRTLFAWDGKPKTEKPRSPKTPEYYAELKAFRAMTKEVFGSAQGYHEEAESDDVVATAALASKADRIIVVSGDKDLLQLHGDRVEVYSLYEKALVPRSYITKKYGIKRPSQVCVALAILGDRVDGIAGIHGWGKKKVAKVFESVTDEMGLRECIDVVMGQMPEELRDGFLRDLDLTILDSGIPGVPEPAPLDLATPDVVREYGVPGLVEGYSKIYRQYSGKSETDEAIEAEEMLD